MLEEHIIGWFMESGLLRLKLKLLITSVRSGEICRVTLHEVLTLVFRA